ncbi:hypothetical protein ESCO_000163 [Escovopsis weberi]|uniref:Uncharacterized protein n=1 Tax=Escovopsis weberi TaxID=150374 RepID=A0A0M9VU34_ESCWE|nr:hypothetical protein ESCO_000163 [Escovopsis weberi]
MAANMQHMAGGQMVAQHQRRPAGGQLQQIVFQSISQHMPAPGCTTWHANVDLRDRMGKTLDLHRRMHRHNRRMHRRRPKLRRRKRKLRHNKHKRMPRLRPKL